MDPLVHIGGARRRDLVATYSCICSGPKRVQTSGRKVRAARKGLPCCEVGIGVCLRLDGRSEPKKRWLHLPLVQNQRFRVLVVPSPCTQAEGESFLLMGPRSSTPRCNGGRVEGTEVSKRRDLIRNWQTAISCSPIAVYLASRSRSPFDHSFWKFCFSLFAIPIKSNDGHGSLDHHCRGRARRITPGPASGPPRSFSAVAREGRTV